MFMRNAERDFLGWEKEQATIAEERRIRIEKEADRRKMMAQELSKKRDEWNKIADGWEQTANSIEGLNDWERRTIPKVANKIRYAGQDSLRGGYANFFREINIKKMIKDDPNQLPHSVRADELRSWMDLPGFLNEWESAFVISMLVREYRNGKSSEKQEAILVRIRDRWGKRKMAV